MLIYDRGGTMIPNEKHTHTKMTFYVCIEKNHTGVYDDDMHVCVCAFAGADWYRSKHLKA